MHRYKLIVTLSSDEEGYVPSSFTQKNLQEKLKTLFNEFFEKNNYMDMSAKFTHVNVSTPSEIEKYLELLKLTAEGLTSKEIAKKVFLSNRTVEAIIGKTCHTFHCRNKIHLIHYLTKNGILN